MKKALVCLSLSIAILSVFSVAFLYSTRSRAVIYSFSPDPDALRPRNYCLLNPFRDKSPEIIAEAYLKRLRAGDFDSIRPLIHTREEADRILENEKKWPIQSWRIGVCHERPGETELMCWVTRGGGYSTDGVEEEVRFWIKHSGTGWTVNSYSAIY
jgi:hypothetical protein